MPNKRKPRINGLFVLGLAFIALGISTNKTFMIIGIVFLIIGLAGMKKMRPADTDQDSSNSSD